MYPASTERYLVSLNGMHFKAPEVLRRHWKPQVKTLIIAAQSLHRGFHLLLISPLRSVTLDQLQPTTFRPFLLLDDLHHCQELAHCDCQIPMDCSICRSCSFDHGPVKDRHRRIRGPERLAQESVHRSRVNNSDGCK
jgi:hypothetical protein